MRSSHLVTALSCLPHRTRARVGDPSGASAFSPRRTASVVGSVILALTAAALTAQPVSAGQAALTGATAAAVRIPRVARPPRLAELLDGQPGLILAEMARISGFIQRDPRDGAPASQRTEAYLGYDDDRLYVVFVAHDDAVGEVRARLMQRENIGGDDQVMVMLDTHHDLRRAYAFRVNPHGVQWDATWTEGGGFDTSFDTVWESDGALTDTGWVALLSIPFKSLRFAPRREQTWGIILSRQIPRGQAEGSFWPAVSRRVEGMLTQAGVLTGLRDVSPGRNLQAIPQASYRAFRTIDTEALGGPRRVSDAADVSAGMDGKAVLRDSLVLDLTANPDFSQVESDLPQVTTNQRFEVFFPERRPFFTENASAFATPMNLVFTRRIRDPRLGARLTGKLGPWHVGAMVIDDEAPGRVAPPGSPLRGARALFTIGRINRDVGAQSTIGVAYAGRQLEGSHNRVGGIDGRVRIGDRWTTTFQALTSSTRTLEGEELAGPAYSASVSRAGRRFNYFGSYLDVDPDFRAETGFFARTDLRRTSHFASYFVRPPGGALLSWGPELFVQRTWDHAGTLLDSTFEVSMEATVDGPTSLELNYRRASEVLRPADFAELTVATEFDVGFWDLEYGTSRWDWLQIGGNFRWGRRINFAPPAGEAPSPARWRQLNASVNLRPITPLRINNTWLYTTLAELDDGPGVLRDHIVSSRWNWQLSRALSLRMILQYEATLTESERTVLPTRKNFNGDFLVTYRLNPWTALFVGYNGNARNVDIVEMDGGGRALAVTDSLRGDARQVFLKLSYLVRF